jgi:hypothetical protein
MRREPGPSIMRMLMKAPTLVPALAPVEREEEEEEEEDNV